MQRKKIKELCKSIASQSVRIGCQGLKARAETTEGASNFIKS